MIQQFGYRTATRALYLLCLLLTACGGDSHGPWTGESTPPGAVTALAGNAGDGVISLGWAAPATGNAPFNYSVQLTPIVSGAVITQSETSALIRGLTNGTSYSISVKASNNAGDGPSSTVQLTPSALASSTNYLSLSVAGNTSGNDSSGIYDPAILRLEDGNIWMTYSSVSYYGIPLVQDVSTSLAFSSDGGNTFNYVRTLGNATNATVTVTNGNVCGSTTCNGRWVYEVPFIVDDASDPDTSRRFKIFAHKYFLYPAANPATIYTLGAIVMWTAPAPDGTWSAEQSVLGWTLTPPELTPNRIVNAIDPALNQCLVVSEGSATTFNGALDFVFACSNGITQKIVQLRSTDHANSFTYVGTLLQASDGAAFNANYFSAPTLIATETNAQLLIATPVAARTINGTSLPNAYSGCVAFPVASEQNATLFRSSSGIPLAILQIPAAINQLNGACAFERNTTSLGVLMNAATIVPLNFGILNTTKNFWALN